MQLKDAAVLIVEDEPILREIFGEWFARIAGKVMTAGNGAEALEVLAENPVELVVSDIRMPLMDGIALLKKVKASGKILPKIVLISGFSDIEPREAYDLGAEAILQKPMERQELLDAMKRSLISRDELWQTSMEEIPAATLEKTYPGLDAALREKQIAFGRGGFCIATSQKLREGPIKLRLEFKADKQVLEGTGMVRWTSRMEGEAGIEIFHVAPQCRRWLAELCGTEGVVAFIPSSPYSWHSTARAV